MRDSGVAKHVFESNHLITKDGFSILSICLIKLGDKTGILHSKPDSQIFPAPEIPRGWRKKRASLFQKAVYPSH